MTNPTIKLVNATTGEEIEREMNAEELKEYEAEKLERLAAQADQDAKAAEKAKLLDKLGINESEAKLLLS
jgi:hypothetical protein